MVYFVRKREKYVFSGDIIGGKFTYNAILLVYVTLVILFYVRRVFLKNGQAAGTA
jgi:hypothetical protein